MDSLRERAGAVRKPHLPGLECSGAVRKPRLPGLERSGAVRKPHLPGLECSGAVRKPRLPGLERSGAVRKPHLPGLGCSGAVTNRAYRAWSAPVRLGNRTYRAWSAPVQLQTAPTGPGVLRRSYKPRLPGLERAGAVRKPHHRCQFRENKGVFLLRKML